MKRKELEKIVRDDVKKNADNDWNSRPNKDSWTDKALTEGTEK